VTARADRPRAAAKKPGPSPTQDGGESGAPARSNASQADPLDPRAIAADPSAGAAGPATKVPFEPSFSWDDPVRLMKSLGLAWREVTDRDTPTFLQLLEETIERVDVDEPTGYLAVHVEGDTHRVIGLRRDAIPPLVATLTGRPREQVGALLGAGPAKIEGLRRPDKSPPRRRAKPAEDGRDDELEPQPHDEAHHAAQADEDPR
jgi:hypothetical protein